ncbi:MAG: hypothetical protein KUA43_18690 [Hoeflea sp.]|uniref:DUF6220 domain-containing protein n=1 Tax=Hoeflea sp. TaxID=1940281 RepID=UPI001D784D6B|nr:DUF6220 domain-containing protein [Hoeflea sp.]MBU4527191.1 hypothetical protein [Alphaproteobacteria bacterium]MBU4547026.1 hypothetical protein [Alphaproteobacteria bacterium]MBU4551462.1 hypothetical protein [Alphaproteobacteria bacterium]MBV1725467.1 hypothetical protein [Hoeflea sp.]MBV1759515.1 hypothetical protein [Hoeflea sp.]
MTPAPFMAALVAGGLVTQAYLAGLGVFGPDGWALHSVFGSVLALPIIGLALHGWFSSSGRPYRLPASLLLVLYLLQVVLVVVGMGTGLAWLAALHPANALLMLVATLEVLRRASA